MAKQHKDDVETKEQAALAAATLAAEAEATAVAKEETARAARQAVPTAADTNAALRASRRAHAEAVAAREEAEALKEVAAERRKAADKAKLESARAALPAQREAHLQDVEAFISELVAYQGALRARFTSLYAEGEAIAAAERTAYAEGGPECSGGHRALPRYTASAAQRDPFAAVARLVKYREDAPAREAAEREREADAARYRERNYQEQALRGQHGPEARRVAWAARDAEIERFNAEAARS